MSNRKAPAFETVVNEKQEVRNCSDGLHLMSRSYGELNDKGSKNFLRSEDGTLT